MEGNRTEAIGRVGTWFIFVALVLGLTWEIVMFPVWEDPSSMRVLLTYASPDPVLFILERAGPTAAILGLIGAALVEKGRPKSPSVTSGWWNRERFLVVAAALYEGAFILSILSPGDFTLGVSWEARFFIGVVSGLVVSVALGLFLFWTAERLFGAPVRVLGVTAIALAIPAWALHSLDFAHPFLLVEPAFLPGPGIGISASLFGAASVAIWVAVYARMVYRGIPPTSSRLSTAPEA